MCRATVADQGPGEAVNDIELMHRWYLQPGSHWDMRVPFVVKCETG